MGNEGSKQIHTKTRLKSTKKVLVWRVGGRNQIFLKILGGGGCQKRSILTKKAQKVLVSGGEGVIRFFFEFFFGGL